MNRTTAFRPMLAAASFAAIFCGAVHGQAFDAVRLYGAPAGDGEGSMGAAVILGHQYQGSKERRNQVFPLLDYRWANGWFAGTTNGVGYMFASAPHLQYGLRVTADFGRSESRSSNLTGLGDIDARPEFGGFFNFFLSRDFFLTSSLRYGAGNDRKGLLLDLGAGYAMQLAPQWRTALGVATTVANHEYMQGYFGISPDQSLSSRYMAYSAGAGIRDVRANASVNYFITQAWTLTGAVSVSSMQGDAKNSPIVTARNPVSGVAVLSRQF